MASNPTTDFRNASKIIVAFNSAQTHFQNYEKYKDINFDKAEDELNTSGVKLYEAFEWSLKHYLYKRYLELDTSLMSRSEANHRKQGLFNAKFYLNRHKIVVDTTYLSEQMVLYANPPIDKDSLDTIKANRWGVTNGQKHQAITVDPIKFKESFKEIRSLLLKYVDPNAPIQIQRSPEYGRLQESNGYWKENPKYDLALVIDDISTLKEEDMELLVSIPWKLIVDFNPDSVNSGLIKAFENLYGYQPNFFDPIKPEKTVFNPMVSSPYWLTLNGRNDLPETVPMDNLRWRRKYGTNLPDTIKRYHQVFSKPLRVVMVDGDVNKLERLIDALDISYEEELKISFLSDETQYESICGEYKTTISVFPMQLEEFIAGLNNFSRLLGLKKAKSEYSVVGKDGEVAISLERFSHLTILHNRIDEDDVDWQKEDFYKAKFPISWRGIKNEDAIVRKKHFAYLCNEILERCKDLPYSILELRHDPGAGGSTLARQVAFHLSKTNPVVLLKCYEDSSTIYQLSELYDKVKTSIIVLVESSLIDDDIEKLHLQLKASGVPHVILFVKRISDKKNRNDNSLSLLNDIEFNNMRECLSEYTTDETKRKLDQLENDPESAYPFLMSLSVFEDDFEGIHKYVKGFLETSNQHDKLILQDIAIIDLYAENLIPLSFFTIIDEDDEIGIFNNNVNDNLILFAGDRIKMRHPLIAQEVLEQLINAGDGDLSSVQRAERLSDMVIGFIKRSKTNDFIDYDEIIVLLKDLLIIRNSEGIIKEAFSPVITCIRKELKYATGDARYNAIGRIFKTLENTYPEEAHFKAHLSRFYSNIELSYLRGVEKAKEAVDLSEEEGITDALLYHIYGTSERKYVERELFEQALTARGDIEEKILDEIKMHLGHASEAFRRTREINHKAAGFISDIDMCISVIDFGKKYYDCSTQELVKQHANTWFAMYFDRAISLMESFNSMQADDETEFQIARLTDKFDSIKELESCIQNTITMWEEYLNNTEEKNKPIARRFIARTRRNVFMKNGNQEDIQAVKTLMEQNIDQEPTNEANIRIWFNALRYVETNYPELLLDEALSKLSIWKNNGNNREAYYYYFILICIKAIERSSRAEAQIPILLKELQDKTKQMPNKNTIYEWLGKGTGIRRLFSGKEANNGKIKYESIAENGEYLFGVVTKYISERSAIIRCSGMDVFFTPAPTGQQKPSITAEDVGKKVKFIMGFAYDGLRALNRSVQIVDGFVENKSNEQEISRGQKVRCKIMTINDTYGYLNVKLVDYHNKSGSIERKELPDGKKLNDYRDEKGFFYAFVKGQNIHHGRAFYQLSLRDEEELFDNWQRKMRNALKEQNKYK